MLNARSVAVDGIGFGALAVAVMGFIPLLEEAAAEQGTLQVTGPWRKWGTAARERDANKSKEVCVVVRLSNSIMLGAEKKITGVASAPLLIPPIKVAVGQITISTAEIGVTAIGPKIVTRTKEK